MNPITRMMKRYIKTPLKYAVPLLCIGVLVLSVSISGCSKSADDVALNVNSMTTSSQIGSYPLRSTPSPGRTYIVFDVTVTNQNKNNLYLGNPFYFTLKTSDGTAYQFSPSSVQLENYLTSVSNTNPGDKVTGKIAFEIPQSATPSELTYSDLNGVVTTNLS
jgi:hypothetical protein